ncbi:hypothetical protein PR048_014894 [Dryococelus australis]|uniref:Uncharacterized protein n=1 Tax=Dryococelus australis TaxID=614101 RepID=A0ABQ9HFK7_9NEOP|nr:hypothetical protein PR048_014894 [Dryococelus australis]
MRQSENPDVYECMSNNGQKHFSLCGPLVSAKVEEFSAILHKCVIKASTNWLDNFKKDMASILSLCVVKKQVRIQMQQIIGKKMFSK